MWIWWSAVACQARMKMMRMLVRCFIHVLDMKYGWSKEGLRSCAMQGPELFDNHTPLNGIQQSL